MDGWKPFLYGARPIFRGQSSANQSSSAHLPPPPCLAPILHILAPVVALPGCRFGACPPCPNGWSWHQHNESALWCNLWPLEALDKKKPEFTNMTWHFGKSPQLPIKKNTSAFMVDVKNCHVSFWGDIYIQCRKIGLVINTFKKIRSTNWITYCTSIRYISTFAQFQPWNFRKGYLKNITCQKMHS